MPAGMFIDGSYVYKVFNGRIDYLKLRQHIESEIADSIDEAYFFNADENPPQAEALHHALEYPPPRGPGFRVKLYWLNKKKLYWPAGLGGGAVMHPTRPNLQYEVTTQKGVDVGLIYHMTRSFAQRDWNKLILAAGDGDFHEPVQALVENHNVDLTLVGTMNSISGRLRPYATRIVELDNASIESQLKM